MCVVHGARFGTSAGFARHVDPTKGARDAVREVELYDPATNTWQVGAGTHPALDRFYHSTAMLVPDGRVVIAGHDGFLNMRPFDRSVYDLEVYSPPYLFRGRRPGIVSAPTGIRYGEVFTIVTDTDVPRIETVAIIRQGSVTHHVNTDQRYVGVAYDRVGSRQLRAFAPPSGNVAPPGYYMLFIVDRRGVPSVGHWTRLGP